MISRGTAVRRIAMKAKNKIVQLTELAILTAIVIVLQLTGVAIRLPFLATPISLVLIPITLGAMILGPKAGAWLGFVFGAVVFITCAIMSLDPFTAYLFQNSPIMTACICLFKSTFAGLFSGLAFKYINIKGKNSLFASFVASAITPIVNTGLFILGCLCISGTINGFISSADLGVSAPYFLIIGCAGINFLFEFAVNMILAPSLIGLYMTITKRLSK